MSCVITIGDRSLRGSMLQQTAGRAESAFLIAEPLGVSSFEIDPGPDLFLALIILSRLLKDVRRRLRLQRSGSLKSLQPCWWTT